MKKILSIFTAMLCAIAVSADPVVLPATLDVSNVSFRSEGMPDFVLEEGDYAGTYFDMGAHDSANDTLLYAEWDVTIEPIKYNIAVDVYNTNSWRVQLYLLNQAGDTLKSLRYKGSSGQCGQYAMGALDLSDLAAGNYKVRVHAATAWSAMKLKDVIFAADYAGVNVDLPGTLLPAYAELSSGASVANDAIAFAPSTANNEYATWNVSFAAAGSYNVTIDMTASNGHTYGVTLLSADGATEIGAVAEAQSWDTGVKALGAIAVPAAGNYKVKLTNATQWSEAVLNSITFAAPAPAHTYTVAGSSADLFGTAWSPAVEANDMVLQEDNTYKWEKTDLTLAAGTIEFKVCEDHAWTNCWPAQNYQLAITEAGIYTIAIYFNPNDNNYVGAVANKTGEAVVIPSVAMHGNFLGSWADTENFAVAEGDATASLTLTLAEGNYEFGMRIGGSGNWTSNGVAFTRENNAAEVVAGQGNLTLAADVAGEYTFTWTYATNNLAITFPAAAPVEMTTIYDWAGEVGTTILGTTGVEISTVKIHENTDAIDGIKFGSSFVYADGKWIAIKPAEGGFKAGDVLSVALVFNNADDTKYAQIDLRAADGDTRIWLSDAASTINGRTSAADPIVQTYTLEADQDSLFLGRYGNTGMFITLLKVERAAGDVPVVLEAPDAAPAAPTYAAYQVHAVYSATYNADCNFGEWSSGTQYTQEEFGKKYVTTGMGYFGLEFTGMDCSEMEALHLDIWAASDLSLRVVPIHGGTEVGVTVNVQGQQWNAIDIALSEFEGVTNWSNVYQIKIDNASNLTFWLNNVYFYTTQEKTVDLVDGYYLIGNINGWDIHNLTADHLFAVNPDNEAEYILHYTLAEGNDFKVVAVANNELGAWYPGEAGNYVVDFAHTGEKDIYFRPDYQGGEGWHAGCIYVEGDANANPWETWFASGDTWNPETESYLEWDGENQKATIHINVDKYGQWRAQVKYHCPVAEEGKCYRVALKMKANHAISNVTVKYQDNVEMIYVSDIALEANVEYVFDQTAAGIAGGNGIMVLDFGFAHAGDIIEIYDVVIEEAECPQVEHTYTVAGGSADLFGTTWDPTNAANDMTKLEDGTYKFEKTEITLPAGAVEFKVVEDHAWTHCWPAENYQLVIPEAGVYTITITYNPEGNVVAGDAVKTGDAQVDPVVSIAGSMNSWNASADVMVLAEDKATASLTLNLAAQTYEFKVVLNGGDWRSNAHEFTRENATAAEMTGNLDNMHLVADVAGEYVFTWTFETNTLSIAFPIGDGIDNTAVETKAIKRIVNGQLFIEMNGVLYNAQGTIVR